MKISLLQTMIRPSIDLLPSKEYLPGRIFAVIVSVCILPVLPFIMLDKIYTYSMSLQT